VIEMWHPTLLIDEVDTFVGDDIELGGMLNHGHKYDGAITRTVGEDHEPRKFSVYGAVALTGIGGLADTLADRSVTIDLKRKRPGEKVTKLRLRHIEQLRELRRRIVRWVADHEESIAKREPKMPACIDDREADNWEILLAIADEAGGEWPERARRAAKAAHAAIADDDVALLELLLADIRDAFATNGTEARDETGAVKIEIASLILAGR
jgi:putative DNA primase/helicase